MRTRPATPADAPVIARIYNQGIEERIATFETRSRSFVEIERWFGGAYPTVIVEDNDGILAFATTSAYSPRECYAGVTEFSVYTAHEARGRAGRRWRRSWKPRGGPATGSSSRASSWRTRRAGGCSVPWASAR